MRLKTLIKRYVPKKVLNLRHLCFAWYGATLHNHPSEELMVIGVTGTSGKSTTVFLLRKLLEAAGYTVGSLSTIDFYIAGEDKLNDQKMTMLGRMQIQKYLREMVEAGCDIAIVETTSEGAVQHRHKFINYDSIVLTNLYPEHIESHGSFENYKAAKLSIFNYIAASKRKHVRGKAIGKSAIVNGNSEHAKDFLNYNFEQKITFGEDADTFLSGDESILVSGVEATKDGLDFSFHGKQMHANMYGEHNVKNITAAVAVARSLGVTWSVIEEAVQACTNAPGRVEFIKEAEEHGFKVIVDYAFEPVAIKALYSIVDLLNTKRVIHVCGSTGGGRDKARRNPIGRIAAEHAHTVIVTNEDPYDEPPMDIIDDVAQGAADNGKKDDKNLFRILDRQEAIEKAVSLAKKGDMILVTGKGSEQAIVVEHDELVPWDDRKAVRTAIAKRFA